jgi:hypothetical protein
MIKGKIKQRVIKDPRISVNKLAEYVLATPSRRKRILLDAKYPKPYITTRYKEVREIAKSFLSGQMTSHEVLKEIKVFEKAAVDAAKIPDNEYQIGYNEQSAEALSTLLATTIPKFYGAKIFALNEQSKIILNKGVSISVKPDLILRADIDGEIHVGAMKLHITQTTTLDDESQKLVGVVLHEYVKKHIANTAKGEIPDYRMCVSYDIFKQRFDVCPAAMKVRLTQVADSCEEIAARWDSI